VRQGSKKVGFGVDGDGGASGDDLNERGSMRAGLCRLVAHHDGMAKDLKAKTAAN
jgi:hypothetical protein